MDINTATEQAYRNGYEAGKRDAEPKWIPVTERSPNEKDFEHLPNYECLVVVRHYNLFDISRYVDRAAHAYWDGEKFISGHSTFSIPLDVTHWMPIPNPPTE